jgi:hypothetical protein
MREHQPGTVPAPGGDDSGGHCSRKAETAPGTRGERAPAWHSSGTHRGDDCGGHHSGKAAIAPGTLGERNKSGTALAPEGDCGGHHLAKAATAPGTM